MFKQTFGATNTGFGSFNAGASTSSPFSGFKPAGGTSAFGAPPAFGANAAPQPAAGGGLFGATTPSNSLFGGNATTSSFGTNSGFGFGAGTSTGGGLFSNTTTGVGGGLFGNNQNNAAFGAKPAGFGFGNTTNTNTTGLFGSAPSTSTGLFGQQNTNIGGGGGLFGNTSGGFGQQQATGTAHVKYNPMVGTDVVVKSGTSQNVNIKHHCITCMKEYEGKSLEELRLEDYVAGRKGATGGVFGGFQQPENKPLFGSGPSFGQPATTSAPSLFGTNIGSTPAFGQTNTFSFGNAAQTNTNTTGLFGANKPAFGAPSTGTGLFGATTTQAPAFGTNTSTFGFGTSTQNQPTGGLFGDKPASTGFGAPAASTGFGAFGSGGGLFGAKPQQTTAPTFGSTAPAFGATPGFGTNTTGSSLFGGMSFGKPPTTQATFAFNTQPTLGTGLGGGLGSSFQSKPAAPAFGSLGGLGTGSMFQAPAQNNTFRTGLDSGLGGGNLFGNNSGLGGNTLGLGQLNANNSSLTGGGLSGASAAGNVHEQILSLAARPYGDTPLFKDLLPDNCRPDAQRATNPACVKAALAGAAYRVSSPPARLPPAPRAPHERKSLFDGLEESDASLEDKLSLKPSRKRLVLRPNTRTEDDADRQELNRSIEELSRQDVNNQGTSRRHDPKDDATSQPAEGERAKQRDVANNNADPSPDIQGSHQGNWLDSSQPWSDKGKRTESAESSSRLYPNLDKELPTQTAERRASWLTTKPLRKPLVPNPESAENSVRELGVRADRTGEDKENIDSLSMSEEENAPTRELPPHPAGVRLTRPGYYTIPSLEEITKYMRPDGSCVVPHLTIGRQNYGNVYFDCEIDVAGLDLDGLVHFLNKEVIIYPDDEHKPPVGEGLNRRAVITLERVWPRDKTEKRPVTEPDRLLKMDYEGKLRRVCDKHDTKFIEYRPQTGSWVFRVEHFSKYGLTDSDEDDDVTPDVLKRQLVNQSVQKSSAPAQKPIVPVTTAAATAVGLAGLGGLGGLGGAGGPGPTDDMFAMQQSSLNLMNGTSRVFEMEAADDNSEATSFYQDNSVFGVKSPTTELARLENRRSHHVQLMKASLYADTDMEEEASVSSGDQLVPLAPRSDVTRATSPPADVTRAACPSPAAYRDDVINAPGEAIMRPLIVTPHTIVLNYHRKVPPFKLTIAGRLHAACIADLSLCRARHARAALGPAGALAYVTTRDVIERLPRAAELSALGSYVSGRGEDDWSESVVARLAIGRTQADNKQDILSRQLISLLEFSSFVEPEASSDGCPRLVVQQSPAERRRLLRRLLADAEHGSTYSISSEYCLQVWKLCDALWGDDLDNDGVPGTDEKSLVNRHKRLLSWLKESVSAITDKELAETRPAEAEDESDTHSARVWTLLAGARMREACELSRRAGDAYMAALLAQSDDPAFKSLVARQLRVWQQCGASPLVAGSRLASLHLLAGLRPQQHLQQLDWLRAFAVTAQYLCPQIPTLEQVIRTYEGYFSSDPEVDLHSLPDDEMGMQFPLPPYLDQYNVTTARGRRRVLDVRYSLLRARAVHAPPALAPAACSSDPFDYSLSFPLSLWLGATGEYAVGAAEQLEANGSWHLALLALAYHRHDRTRSHLIRQVLSRHVPSQVDTPEMKERFELIKRLRIPEKWVLIAQANRAKYEHKPALEVEYLVGAEQWNAAHRVILNELLPDAVLSDNLQSIKDILEKMNAAAERHEVSGWETGGQALYHYLKVCDEIRGLVRGAGGAGAGAGGGGAVGAGAGGGGAVGARLEALRPALAAACRSLRGLSARSPRHAAARAEMGARLVQLALAGGEPPPHLAALLAQLRLPPDCAARAAYKVAAGVAERASAQCVAPA